MTKILSSAFLLLVLALLIPGQALAADGGVCPREETGAVVRPPPDLYAKDGKLVVRFNYYTSVSDSGLTLFCFVTNGACGAIVVEGIENIQPAVAGLPQRVIVLRDQALVDGPGASFSPNQPVPFWDLSINYVPIVFPVEKAAVLKMHAGQKEFWRVVNATANSILDIQLKYDGVKQPLQVVAFDGVPTGSQDGKHQGTIITENDILLPPAGRAEFIVTAPDDTVKAAQFSTETIDTGPLGDSLPFRPLANIALTKEPLDLPVMPKPGRNIAGDRFAGLEKIK